MLRVLQPPGHVPAEHHRQQEQHRTAEHAQPGELRGGVALGKRGRLGRYEVTLLVLAETVVLARIVVRGLGQGVVARADARGERHGSRPGAGRRPGGPPLGRSGSGLSSLVSGSSSARSSTDLNGFAPGGSGGSSPYPATIAAQAASSSMGHPLLPRAPRGPPRAPSLAVLPLPLQVPILALLAVLAVGVVLSHLRPSLPCRDRAPAPRRNRARAGTDERDALREDPVRIVVQRRHVVALFQQDLRDVRRRHPAEDAGRVGRRHHMVLRTAQQQQRLGHLRQIAVRSDGRTYAASAPRAAAPCRTPAPS